MRFPTFVRPGTLALLLWGQLCIGVAFATPLEPLSADLTRGRVARGLKPVGSRCASDVQCLSKRCLSDGLSGQGNPTPKTCHRQQPGGPCTLDSNCQTRSCDKTAGICLASRTSGVCVEDIDCRGSATDAAVCVDKKCKRTSGQPCLKSTQCQSGTCANSVCTTPPAPLLPANELCERGDQCFSGTCQPIRCDYRRAASRDGYGYPGPLPSCDTSVCAGVAVGGTCRTTDDCISESQECSAAKTCLSRNDIGCASKKECLSGYCSGEGRCANAAGTKAL